MTEHAIYDRNLCEAYTEELAVYTEILTHLDRTPEPGSDPQYGEGWVQVLDAGMAKIGALETVIASDKEAWDLAGRRSSPPLKSAMEKLADTIQQLMRRIEGGADLLQKRREMLRPELNQVLRAHQMRRAYQEAKVSG